MVNPENVLAPEILYLNSDKYEFVSVRSSSLFMLIGFSVLMCAGCYSKRIGARDLYSKSDKYVAL